MCSEDNLQDFILLHHHVGLIDTTQDSELVTGAFSHWAIATACFYALVYQLYQPVN